MIKIAEVLPSHPSSLWKMVKQCGVNDVVAGFDRSVPDPSVVHPDHRPWSFTNLMRMKAAFKDGGFNCDVIEARPPLNKAKLGLPDRDQEIEYAIDLIRNMGKVGIKVWCHEWMPVLNWTRTSTVALGRGGAYVTGYDNELMKNAPLTDAGEVSEDQLWDNLKYYLEKIVPVAEEAGVQLAMHPDDPPLSPIRGMGRIMRSVETYQRLIDLVPSEANGICLCQGNFTLMTDELPDVIRHFGDKIYFVHFRDVRGTPENFVETFHDEGKTDMRACMQAYRDIGFEGVLRPDHVPTMEGDDNNNPGYSSIGRLFAIGYIKGLREAVYAEK